MSAAASRRRALAEVKPSVRMLRIVACFLYSVRRGQNPNRGSDPSVCRAYKGVAPVPLLASSLLPAVLTYSLSDLLASTQLLAVKPLVPADSHFVFLLPPLHAARPSTDTRAATKIATIRLLPFLLLSCLTKIPKTTEPEKN